MYGTSSKCTSAFFFFPPHVSFSPLLHVYDLCEWMVSLFGSATAVARSAPPPSVFVESLLIYASSWSGHVINQLARPHLTSLRT